MSLVRPDASFSFTEVFFLVAFNFPISLDISFKEACIFSVSDCNAFLVSSNFCKTVRSTSNPLFLKASSTRSSEFLNNFESNIYSSAY